MHLAVPLILKRREAMENSIPDLLQSIPSSAVQVGTIPQFLCQ